MKNFFPGQYRPSDDDLALAWKNGTFVFDTNVLLNLYSYPESVREIFISVLEKICDRSWIPYHVALEFHRNRFARIKQANTPLLNLRDRIRATSVELENEIKDIEFEKRNTGVDNLEERLQSVKVATSLLAEALDKACERLPQIGLDDPIAKRISVLFEKKVGFPPVDQAALDAIIHDGDDRYEKKIPPGFKDMKEKKDIKFHDREITYPAMFGDLIIWRQVIGHVKNANINDVIFVTGDRKEDWWHIVDRKTLGPLPDLVREFMDKSGAERFWMYTADQFLKYAETYLSAKEVTPETVEQVREISNQNKFELKDLDYSDILRSFDNVLPKFLDNKFQVSKNSLNRNKRVHARVINNSFTQLTQKFIDWLHRHHEVKDLIHSDFPDIIVSTENGVFGYELISTSVGLQGLLKKAQQIADIAVSLEYELSIAVLLRDDVADEVIDRFLGSLCSVLARSSVRRVIVGDLFLNEFNVRKVLRVPEL